MKHRTFVLLLVIMLLAGGAGAFALDFGVTVSSSTEVSVTDSTDVAETAKAAAYLNHWFSPQLETSVQGSYTYTLDRLYLFDVDHAYARLRTPVQSGETPWYFDGQAGRFVFRDFTGNVLASSADGARLNFQLAGTTVKVGAGYFGLLAKENSSIILSRSDLSDSTNGDKFLAPPRAFFLLNISMPQYLGRQSLDFSFVAQKDYRSESDLATDEGLLDTQYVGLGVSGPLTSSLYYNSYAYLEGGRMLTNVGGFYEYHTIGAFLGGLGLRYFVPGARSSVGELSFLFSSGDSDFGSYYEGNTADHATMFQGITAPGFGVAFSPKLGNLMVLRANYSVKPFSGSGYSAMENFQARLAGFGFFRPTDGVISEAGINPASDAAYLGSEADLILSFRPFSDLGFALSSGIFMPNSGSATSDAAFLDDVQKKFQFVGRFDLSVTF